MVRIDIPETDIGKIRIVRSNAGGNEMNLVINGVVVGKARAIYQTETQRRWDAELEVNINGIPFGLSQKDAFSAIRIAMEFESQIRARLLMEMNERNSVTARKSA